MNPSASTLLSLLRPAGVTHVVGVPDNSSAALFDAVQDDPDIRLLTVTREGEAFAVASGLWVGGAVPVVLIQNTGLLESGDSLRGTAGRMGVPLLCIVTFRGFAKMVAAGMDPARPRPSRDTLVRPDIDSVALMTEPTLDAWSVPYRRYGSDADASQFTAAWEQAATEQRPVALLLTRGLI